MAWTLGKKELGWPRKGAGRKPGGGGPVTVIRRNRVVVMLTDGELANLRRVAEGRELPLGTVAHEFVARALTRRR